MTNDSGVQAEAMSTVTGMAVGVTRENHPSRSSTASASPEFWRAATTDVSADPALAGGAVALMLAGVPEGTRRSYEADRRDFRAWCAGVGVEPLPVSGEVLAQYVSHLLLTGSVTVPEPRPLSARTAERRLAAISSWSREQGHGRPDQTAARLVLRGHRRTAGDPRPAQAAPVDLAALRAMLAAADLTGSPARAARDRVLLLVGFSIAGRRSELCQLDLADLVEVSQGLLVRVLRRKTSQHGQDLPVPYGVDPTVCPVLAVQRWRALLAAQGIYDGPLLRPVSRTGRILTRRLGADAVTEVVRRLAEDAALPPPSGYARWSAHGLRRGAATEAKRHGADLQQIAELGSWKPGSATLWSYLAAEERWASAALRGVL